MDDGRAEPILQLRTHVQIGSLWGRTEFPGSVSIFPGRVVIVQGPLSRPRSVLAQTSPRVQVVKTRLALPGANLHLVAWEGSRFATAVLLPEDLPGLRSALYDAGFTMARHTQWIFTLTEPPAENVTRYPGIAGKTISVRRNSQHRPGNGDHPRP